MVLESCLGILWEAQHCDASEELDSQKSMSEIVDIIEGIITENFLGYAGLISTIFYQI
jgi:hypothetical protein